MSEPVTTATASAVSLPALPVMVAVARQHVAHCWGDRPRLADALVAASELVTNAVLHGTADTVTITVAVGDRAARIDVAESGRPRRRPDHPAAGESGRGLGIVALLAAETGHTRTDHGTTAWAVIDLDAAP